MTEAFKKSLNKSFKDILSADAAPVELQTVTTPAAEATTVLEPVTTTADTVIPETIQHTKHGVKEGELNTTQQERTRNKRNFSDKIKDLKNNPEESTDVVPQDAKYSNEPDTEYPEINNFKTLRNVLTKKDEELKTLRETHKQIETDLKKYKDDVEVKERLLKERETQQELINEVLDFKSKANLLTSRELQETIIAPRTKIANTIKAELEQEGIDPSIWEMAIQTTTRAGLERVVNDHIESELLRNQFYNMFFEDIEYRKKEVEALKAPEEYLSRVRKEELDKKTMLKASLESGLQSTFTQATQDAFDIESRAGDNKILELTLLKDNDKHNKETVEPLIRAADEAALAMLKERVELGLPVDREVATRITYLWRKAVAAQAVNKDRLNWYNKHREVSTKYAELEQKYQALLQKGHPGITSRDAGGQPKPQEFKRGSTLKESIANFAKLQTRE
jgi:hypothetical protein